MENNGFNWNEVVDFFSKKYVSSRAAFTGSEAYINNNVIEVNLKSKSKFMMLSRNMDKLISDFVMNSSGSRYEVKFNEPDSFDVIPKQDEIIKKMMEENMARQAELTTQRESETHSKKVNGMPDGYGTKAQSNNINDADIPNWQPPTDSDIAGNSAPAQQYPPKQATQNSWQGGNNWQGGQNGGAPRRAPKKKNLDMVEDIEKLIYKGWRETQNPKNMRIVDFSPEQPGVIIKGKTSNYESRETKNGGYLISFDIYDGSSSINVKAFLKANEYEEVHPKMKGCPPVRLIGTYEYNNFSREFGVIADMIEETTWEEKIRMDNAPEKRVELHMHTQMSQMDGMTSATALIKRAIKWGHKAVAITDHGVVQAFPEAKKAIKDSDLKVLYGVEAYLSPDRFTSIINPGDQLLKDVTYSVLDIETTGL